MPAHRGPGTAAGDLAYIHVEPPQDDHVHVRFTGPFQGREITWDAWIVTLEYEYRERQASPHTGGVKGLRQFIEVGCECGEVRPLRIGLNLGQIDEPVIRKAIIMARQYRRLHEGRHEYGDTWSPPGSALI